MRIYILKMLKILFGIAYIIAGLSGDYVLKGTESSGGLAIVGVLLVLWGGWGLYKKANE